jgi:Tfp pilus assembly protein PilF
LKELERAVELDPRNAVYRNSFGLTYFSLGEYELSEAQFKRALKLDPSYTEVHANLGLVYSEMERYDLAVQEYATAVADPGYLTPERVYINWGLTLEKQNDMVGAQAKLREAVATNPRYPRGHYELARFLEDHGDEPGALEEYLRAWSGMSEVPVLNLKIGEILLNRGDDGQARRYLEKVIAVAPDSAEAGQARVHLDRLSRG